MVAFTCELKGKRVRISHTLALACLVLTTLAATTSHAKVYRCKDATGATVFSGTPCGGDAQELNIAMIGTDREVRQPAPSQTAESGANAQSATRTVPAEPDQQPAARPAKRQT
jgi:hypothetical protein